ncbi:Protein of unknown function [Cotesia congregata]|uniref:USP domain-containing protein n=1 Tax=Cotesia congregata TaxID=51543 RepID=A0A8J2HR71_COTCN|nr:Protein of unknown function [Cotesia congregata]
MKVHLLKNGNSCKPVCVFKVVIGLFATRVLSIRLYNYFSTTLYKLEILYPFYKETEKKQPKIKDENLVAVPLSRVITCEDNVSSLWARLLFANEPSVLEENSCPTPKCINNNNTKNVSILSVNYSTIIRRGFGALEKALDFHSIIYNMRCQYCHSNKKISKRTPNLFIYIELDVKKPGETEGRMCKLREFPVYLNLEANESGDNLRYRLSGVAGYSTFHYIAYCRRVSGSWISYNDVAKKPEMVGDNLSITPHRVLYIVIELYYLKNDKYLDNRIH